MRVRIRTANREVKLVEEATEVVVQDDHGQTIAVTVEQLQGMIRSAHAADPDFVTVLNEVGLQQTAQVHEI